jgi:hypothetical protein
MRGAGRDEKGGMTSKKTAILVLGVAAALFFSYARTAQAALPSYVFDGGTAAEQHQVTQALAASSFNWSLIPQTITVHIGNSGQTDATPGNVYLASSLLDSGSFSWGVVQHEFGHQIDFLLLNDSERAQLQSAIGGSDWCYSVAGLPHSSYGCERFASELSWAYWPSADNCMKPTAQNPEGGFMPVARFRSLLASLLGQPSLAAAPPAAAGATTFAPRSTKTAR